MILDSVLDSGYLNDDGSLEYCTTPMTSGFNVVLEAHEEPRFGDSID
jgi:hypothetical protein